ncbi:MAG TPA: glycosyltransferase family 4 protein [Gaiellaceae bacterium]|nr:glycosyltransferase family 4 protein [Gaiellaceae bacterium]
MRICIVTVASYAHGIGGMQAHSADLCKGLVAAGHEVEVITARHPQGLTSADHLGGAWHFYDATSKKPGRPFRNRDWLTTSAAAFDELHAARPFDTVHSESTSALGLLRRGVHRRVPLVAKFHGNYLGLAGATVRRALRESGLRPRVREAKHLAWLTVGHVVPPDVVRFRGCEAMVPSHQQVKGTARSYFLDPSRVHVVPNGIAVEEFASGSRDDARAKLGLGPEPMLLCVGRLARDKGFATAIEALAHIASPDARLVILGAGPERGLLEETARRAGVSDRVDFLGSKPRAEVVDHLVASDVFLFPTERDEAAPLVPLEAMAAGLPVVASDIGGGAELIESGLNGLLVPPAAVDSLAGAIDSLLAGDALRRRMGEAARERIVERYTIEAMTRQTVAVYELAAERLQKDG